jgi:hypothetical protein
MYSMVHRSAFQQCTRMLADVWITDRSFRLWLHRLIGCQICSLGVAVPAIRFGGKLCFLLILLHLSPVHSGRLRTLLQLLVEFLISFGLRFFFGSCSHL